MNYGAKVPGLPDLTANLLRDGGCLIDNLFADLWRQMRIKAKLKRLGFHKRSGIPSDERVFALMILVWLKVDSIGMFARESLKTLAMSLLSSGLYYRHTNQQDRCCDENRRISCFGGRTR